MYHRRAKDELKENMQSQVESSRNVVEFFVTRKYFET